ncbi:S8 family serine peptidase [Pseudolysobacter antarcticus]|nr:S8 family serine peptidase [Pseudolysobacter antarcticus]
MHTSVRSITRALSIGLALIAAGFSGFIPSHAAEVTTVTAHPFAAAGSVSNTTDVQPYIITFSEAGVLHNTGTVAGLQSTAPKNVDGQRKLDVHSAAAQSYAKYLANQRSAYIDTINHMLGRTLVVTHHYAITANAIATDLSAAEAASVAAVSGVQSVRVAGQQQLTIYRGPKFIGADTIWSGSATPTHVGTTGKGIVVGDLDAGTSSSHPAFADDANCGFRALVPKLVAVDCSSTDINGYCHGANPQANPGFGHGVHTSSTIAGNTINAANSNPAPNLPGGVSMSGVAPCAAIHHYKVCETDSCDGASILAGVQNAIADQVDVLNFSISGGTDPWNDNDRDFLDAVNADIFVAAAAGNLQGAQTDPHSMVNHLGPWVMTVAASTQDQYIGAYMKVTGPGSVPPGIANLALTPGSTTTTVNSIDKSGLPLISYPTNLIGCSAEGGFPANYFLGAVAVIRRGECPFTEKISNAVAAGATRVLIGNNVNGTIAMDTTGAPSVPAFSLDGTSSDALLVFIAPLNPAGPPGDRIFSAGMESLAAASGGGIGWYRHLLVGATQGDVLASFSYRGPVDQDATKPNITAPGVNIYAASDVQDGNYAYMSGTSMATPHVTGAGALVRAVHPDWSVQEVKSALMMTAVNNNGVLDDGTTPWTSEDVGSGRVDLSKATLAGLTMDETYANFVAANPDGATPIAIKTLNLPDLRDMACALPSCSWSRTVRNRLASAGNWTISTTAAASFAVSASPASFTLAAGATQTIVFTATRSGAAPTVVLGNVILTESSGLAPPQHISVAIRQPPPPSVGCSSNSCSLVTDNYPGGTITNALGSQLNGLPHSMIWLNRFSPAPTDYPITLNTVQTAFDAANTDLGDTFDVFVYQDNDSYPSNGAVLKGSFAGQVITAPQDSFQTITIPGGLTLTGSGDILIALVTRKPSRFPASVDAGLPNRKRSWIGGVNGEVIPAAPDLSMLTMYRVDQLVLGFNFNWIIRAQGSNASGPIALGFDSSSLKSGK